MEHNKNISRVSSAIYRPAAARSQLRSSRRDGASSFEMPTGQTYAVAATGSCRAFAGYSMELQLHNSLIRRRLRLVINPKLFRTRGGQHGKRRRFGLGVKVS